MKFIKRSWTPVEADEWTKEDWITIIISPIAYILMMVGVALSLVRFRDPRRGYRCYHCNALGDRSEIKGHIGPV